MRPPPTRPRPPAGRYWAADALPYEEEGPVVDAIDIDTGPAPLTEREKEDMIHNQPWQHDMFFQQEQEELVPKGQLLVEGQWLSLYDVFPTARSELAHSMPRGFIKGLHCHAWRFRDHCASKEDCNFIHAVAEKGKLYVPPPPPRPPPAKRPRFGEAPSIPPDLGFGVGRDGIYEPEGAPRPAPGIAPRPPPGLTVLPPRPGLEEGAPLIGRGVRRADLDSGSDTDSVDNSMQASQGDSATTESGSASEAPPAPPRRSAPDHRKPRARHVKLEPAPPLSRRERLLQRADRRTAVAAQLRQERAALERRTGGRATSPAADIFDIYEAPPSRTHRYPAEVKLEPESPGRRRDYRRQLWEVRRAAGKRTRPLEYDPERPQPVFQD